MHKIEPGTRPNRLQCKSSYAIGAHSGGEYDEGAL